MEWVKRMQELKNKLAGGDGAKGKDKSKKKTGGSHTAEEKIALEAKIDTYRQRLITEFKYTRKDIEADPDMQEMMKLLASMKWCARASS